MASLARVLKPRPLASLLLRHQAGLSTAAEPDRNPEVRFVKVSFSPWHGDFWHLSSEVLTLRNPLRCKQVWHLRAQWAPAVTLLGTFSDSDFEITSHNSKRLRHHDWPARYTAGPGTIDPVFSRLVLVQLFKSAGDQLSKVQRCQWGHFYQHGLTAIPAWIKNHICSKAWDEITHAFPNLNNAAVGS